MDKKQTIGQAIERGIAFLAEKQQGNGSFAVLVGPATNLTKAQPFQTVFSTALILQTLNTLQENAQLTTIKKRVADFLLAQKSEHWTFNYWAKQAKEFKTIPYPDDLDDTSCALTALFKYNTKIIDGAVLGKFVMILTALEKKEGGPYRTWLVNKTADKIWQYVDLAVNSNIAYFLSLQEVNLPNLTNFVEKAIETKNFYSPYYASPFPVIYFISRFYQGNKKQQLIDFVLSKQINNSWDNPLNTALSILALLNLGTDPEKLTPNIAFILKNQQGKAWQPYPFYIDAKKSYAGSPALTTTFCLEALNKFKNITASKQPYQTIFNQNEENKQENIYQKIVKEAKTRHSLLGTHLKQYTLKAIDQTLKTKQQKQIVLLPYLFKIALGKNGQNISDKIIIELGLANLYGWTAYTIYDDFLDEEGKPSFLPTANLLLRELCSLFNNILPVNTGFHNIFNQIMDRIDSANTWEINNCRLSIKNGQFKIPNNLPNYQNYTLLADRSLGHALGPIAILFMLGFNKNSEQVEKVISFFKHYIISRQINDDAHDWQEDLEKGHLDSANSNVLKKYQEFTDQGKLGQVDIKKVMPDLQKIFWYETIPEIGQEALNHIKSAKQIIESIPLIENKSIILNLLTPVEKSSQKVLFEREETIKFLKAYKL